MLFRWEDRTSCLVVLNVPPTVVLWLRCDPSTSYAKWVRRVGSPTFTRPRWCQEGVRGVFSVWLDPRHSRYHRYAVASDNAEHLWWHHLVSVALTWRNKPTIRTVIRLRLDEPTLCTQLIFTILWWLTQFPHSTGSLQFVLYSFW